MKTTVFSSHKFEEPYLIAANHNRHELNFLDLRLSESTVLLAPGAAAISLFTNDDASSAVLLELQKMGSNTLPFVPRGTTMWI